MKLKQLSWLDGACFFFIVALLAFVFSVARAQEPPCVYKVAATDTNAYRLVQNLGPQSVGDFVLRIAGQVPVGTVCDTAQMVFSSGKTYVRIPRTAVTWAGNNRPATAWAICVADSS